MTETGRKKKFTQVLRERERHCEKRKREFARNHNYQAAHLWDEKACEVRIIWDMYKSWEYSK